MGLALEVGFLAYLKQNDEEGFAHFNDELARLNSALLAKGLQAHREPEDIADENIFSCDMYGCGGLHYLRRLAAFEAFGLPMPSPGDDNAPDDPVLTQYYLKAEEKGSFFSRLFGQHRPAHLDFAHLILHSDGEGYYVPQDFEHVITPDTSLQISGCMIGSTQRLLAECKRLAVLLELPPDLDYESDEVYSAVDTQGEGDTKWQRYGIESFTCIQLIRACEASLRLGAMICFC